MPHWLSRAPTLIWLYPYPNNWFGYATLVFRRVNVNVKFVHMCSQIFFSFQNDSWMVEWEFKNIFKLSSLCRIFTLLALLNYVGIFAKYSMSLALKYILTSLHVHVLPCQLHTNNCSPPLTGIKSGNGLDIWHNLDTKTRKNRIVYDPIDNSAVLIFEFDWCLGYKAQHLDNAFVYNSNPNILFPLLRVIARRA